MINSLISETKFTELSIIIKLLYLKITAQYESCYSPKKKRKIYFLLKKVVIIQITLDTLKSPPLINQFPCVYDLSNQSINQNNTF